MRVFDGCTEFSSETKAFRDRCHEVVTLGIAGNVDIHCDIRQWYPSADDCYDFMWFSPPCTEFSIANNPNLGGWKERKPDLSVVQACFRIIETCKPRYWCIENPSYGLSHWIGKPRIQIRYSDFGYHARKKTDLWGHFPLSFLKYKTPTPIKDLVNLKRAKRCLKSETGVDRTKNRSLIPYQLSLAFCLAIESELQSSHDGKRLHGEFIWRSFLPCFIPS